MSFACRPPAGAGFIVNPVDVTSVGDDVVSPSASAQIGFDNAGAILQAGNTTVAGALWGQGITPANYWARLTVTAGSAPTSGSATSTWLQLNSSRSWTWTRASLGTTSATITLEIASDSGGTTIVASKTGIPVSVSVTS